MSEWTKVNDRQPTEEGLYLCWARFVDAEYPVIDFWHQGADRWVDHEGYITHWQPVDPPQDKDNANL